MKVFASIFAIAAIASAAATPNMKRQTTSLCGPLDTPQCCSVDVLGVADLNCASSPFLTAVTKTPKADSVIAVPNTITTTAEFTSYCAESGTEARCCVLSLVRSPYVDSVLDTDCVFQLGSDGLLCSGVA